MEPKLPLDHCSTQLSRVGTTQVESLTQPHAEEYSLMFTDVECTHYISHNPINKHVFHPHYINLDPINKQIEHSHSFLRYPPQRVTVPEQDCGISCLWRDHGFHHYFIMGGLFKGKKGVWGGWIPSRTVALTFSTVPWAAPRWLDRTQRFFLAKCGI